MRPERLCVEEGQGAARGIPAGEEAHARALEVLDTLIGADWPDRAMCLRVCGMALVLARLDPLPRDVANDVHAVTRHLLHCTCSGQAPDWVALAGRLRRTLARCGLVVPWRGAAA
jgi:hypothetical protein